MPRQSAPLLERQARRYASAIRASRSDDWKARARVDNRMGHIRREAERAGITHDSITAEARRLGLI